MSFLPAYGRESQFERKIGDQMAANRDDLLFYYFDIANPESVVLLRTSGKSADVNEDKLHRQRQVERVVSIHRIVGGREVGESNIDLFLHIVTRQVKAKFVLAAVCLFKLNDH